MLRKTAVFLIATALALATTATAEAFCGFYVAKADTSLFNKASQVVLVRDGDRTVITMANDFRGNPREFAMVIPVPTAITREQIHVAESALVKHLDAYTAPRLVEYFDPDPCAMYDRYRALEMAAAAPSAVGASRREDSGQEPRRDHRGAIHGGRVRHPHPLGGAELRARDVAARERLPHPGRRHRGARQLHPPEHALLRRQGEPGRAGQARRGHAQADPGGLRVAEVHAADPPRHGERRRGPGAVRLHPHPQGPGREHQLPHGQAADRRRDSRLREGSGGVLADVPGALRPARDAART